MAWECWQKKYGEINDCEEIGRSRARSRLCKCKVKAQTVTIWSAFRALWLVRIDESNRTKFTRIEAHAHTFTDRLLHTLTADGVLHQMQCAIMRQDIIIVEFIESMAMNQVSLTNIVSDFYFFRFQFLLTDLAASHFKCVIFLLLRLLLYSVFFIHFFSDKQENDERKKVKTNATRIF